MILISVSTRNRFWNFALTMLCLANAEKPAGILLHLIDDATDDGSLDDKRRIIECLGDATNSTGWLHTRFEHLPERNGVNGVMSRFLDHVIRADATGNGGEAVTHWIHLDDDLVFSPDVLRRAIEDYERYLRRGLVYLFMNEWVKPLSHCNGPLWSVHELGGAAFITSRRTVQSIGNPFADDAVRRGPCEQIWERYRAAGETLAFNRDEPYQIQHTANADSLIFGKQPRWANLWSKDLRTNEFIDVPPYGFAEVRAAVDSGQLEKFVREANERAKFKLPLPERKFS